MPAEYKKAEQNGMKYPRESDPKLKEVMQGADDALSGAKDKKSMKMGDYV